MGNIGTFSIPRPQVKADVLVVSVDPPFACSACHSSLMPAKGEQNTNLERARIPHTVWRCVTCDRRYFVRAGPRRKE